MSLSLSQAGRKTYAMVSGCSASQSLASELVESNDGHEEIIKVSFIHLHLSPSLMPGGSKGGFGGSWSRYSGKSSDLNHIATREGFNHFPSASCGGGHLGGSSCPWTFPN